MLILYSIFFFTFSFSLDETCSHVGAILFKMEAAVRIGFTRVTPTDLPQLWNQNFIKHIDGDKVANILIYTEKAKAKIKSSQPSTLRDPIDLDSFEQFLSEIQETSPDTVALSLFGAHQENFIIKTPGKEARPHLPSSLRLLYDSKHSELDEDEYAFLAMRTINKIKESNILSAIAYVEETTRNQALSPTWFKQRAGRITGSIFRSVYMANIEDPNKDLVKKICSDTAKRVNAPPLEWGRSNEEVALALYTEVHGSTNFVPGNCEPIADCHIHYDLNVLTYGLAIYHDIPWFAASPDAVVHCSCCGYGVVEIKCPYAIGNSDTLTLKVMSKMDMLVSSWTRIMSTTI